MRKQAAVVVLAVLLLLAGCSTTTPAGGDTSTPEPSPTPTETPTATPTPTASPTPTATPTPTAIPIDEDNPHQKRTLHLYVEDRSDLDINRTAELRNATAYWEANAEAYAGYPIDFEFVNNSSAADFDVVIRDEIEQCGAENTSRRTLGCAPLGGSFSTRDTFELVADLLPRDFEHVATHEFGHVLGLQHGAEPAHIMNSTYEGHVIERVYRYHVDVDGYHTGGTKDQIEAGLGFIEGGANGTIETDVRFREVHDPDNADFDITVSDDESVCDGEYTACWNFNHSPATIKTGGIKRSWVGWIVSKYAYKQVAYDVGAADTPWEYDSDNVDPGKSWWR